MGQQKNSIDIEIGKTYSMFYTEPKSDDLEDGLHSVVTIKQDKHGVIYMEYIHTIKTYLLSNKEDPTLNDAHELKPYKPSDISLINRYNTKRLVSNK